MKVLMVNGSPHANGNTFLAAPMFEAAQDAEGNGIHYYRRENTHRGMYAGKRDNLVILG